jgi:c-di-GMP-binding flagellar brake protein YcgR
MMRAVGLAVFDQERRQSKRVSLATNAYLLPTGAKRRALSAMVENISVGGLALRAPYAIPIGKLVHVLIELDGHPIDTTALILRGGPSVGYGLRFINVDRVGLEKICRHVAQKAEVTVNLAIEAGGFAGPTKPAYPRRGTPPPLPKK